MLIGISLEGDVLLYGYTLATVSGFIYIANLKWPVIVKLSVAFPYNICYLSPVYSTKQIQLPNQGLPDFTSFYIGPSGYG